MATALDGLKVLETLVDWPGSRILLTGQADEQIAVKAFNSGLIDQFVPKQTHDITRHLLGLFHGQPGGRAFRQVLSEGAHRPGADWRLVEAALAATASAARVAA